MQFEIDKTKWSASSQRSLGRYDERARYYEDLSFRCTKCERSFLFTAAQQKEAFEERKEYVRRYPTLCQSCAAQRELLLATLKECQSAWVLHKDALSHDRTFLERWRVALREIASYGRKGSNPSVVTMLSRLLQELPQSASSNA